jgi:hypothetical protein
MTGIEELRACVEALNNCREDFLNPERDTMSAEQLLKIWRMWQESGKTWDIWPDQWTKRQVKEALRGVVPRWNAQGKPVYGDVEASS